MRIDEIVARLLPEIESRVFRANAEVTAAIVGNGWTQRIAVPPKRQARERVQYEMGV